LQMTETEVAGPAEDCDTLGLSATWSYSVAAPLGAEPERLVVVFGNGRVSGIRREEPGWFTFPR